MAFSISKLLYEFGDETVRLLRESIEKEKAVATRNLKQSIVYEVKILGSEFVFVLKMADYWKWVDQGRAPSSGSEGGVVKPKIYEWIRRKRDLQAIVGKMADAYKSKHPGTKKNRTKLKIMATKSLSFLISRKIHKKGYSGKRFYSNVMTPSYLESFKDHFRKTLKRDVSVAITQIFDDLK